MRVELCTDEIRYLMELLADKMLHDTGARELWRKLDALQKPRDPYDGPCIVFELRDKQTGQVVRF